MENTNLPKTQEPSDIIFYEGQNSDYLWAKEIANEKNLEDFNFSKDIEHSPTMI